jgi:DNA-binding ferritin-like protein
MAEDSYEQLDELFSEIRLRLVQMRQTDPASVEELKRLVSQLELWVESLVIDSLKLKSLESFLQKTTKLANRLRKRLDEGEESPQDRTVRDITRSLEKDISQATGKKQEG